MELIVIGLLIVLNGVFAMSEIAMVSARKSRLESDARRGSKSARAALRLAEEPNRFLSTVQIGITLIGILTGLYSGEAFAGDFAKVIARVPALAPWAGTIATVTIVLVVTYLTILFGELVPKRLGLTWAERIFKAVARPMAFLSRVMTPAVWLLSQSTALVMKLTGGSNDEEKEIEQEIKTLVKEGLDTGEVQEVEHDIVGRVFSLGDRDIDSIMTHRSDFVWLDAADDKETIRRKVMENLHSIYPVRSDNQDELRGVVQLNELFGQIDDKGFSLEKLIRPTHYLPDNKSVYSALEFFKQNKVKYGFVTDEFGDVKGIVTLTDILDGLVGEVLVQGEEHDIVVREDGSVLVSGQCPFYDFVEHFDMEELDARHEYNTLGGLILDTLEHIPHEGEKLSWECFDMEIVDMDGPRIDKVLVYTRHS